MPSSSNVSEMMTTSKLKELLFERIVELSIGTFISYANMHQWTGIEKRTKIQSLMRSVKRRLEKEGGYFLKTEHDKGYRILPRGEEYTVPVDRYKKARKHIGEAVRQVNCIRLKEIPEDKKAITTATVNFMTNKWGMMGAFALPQGEEEDEEG